jgi:hypothetical protein
MILYEFESREEEEGMIKLALSLFPKIIPLEEWTTDGLRGKSSHPQYLANKLVKRLWYGWAGINIAHRPGKDPLWALFII